MRKRLAIILVLTLALSLHIRAQQPVTLNGQQVGQLQSLLSQIAALLNPPSGISVQSGSDLQAAINAAAPGSTLLIQPGDYAPITISKPLTLANAVPVPSRRVLGTDDPKTFWRITATGVPAVTMTAPVTLIGFRGSRTDINPPIVSITGDWATGSAQLIDDWISASAAGSRRGVEANGGATLISQSRIDNCWFQGQDAQAVAGWNQFGPLTVSDSYLEGSTQALQLGGADAVDQAHQPKNFTLKNSLLTKQVAWMTKLGLVKTSLELKNCAGFTITDNIIEYSWVDGQSGYLLQLTPRNQNGGNPWATVSGGVIQRNLFRHGVGGIDMLGTDNNNPSGRLSDVQFLNNRFEDVNGGRMVLIQAGPQKLVFDHNTFVGSALNSFLSFDGTPHIAGLTYTNNLAMEGDYGIAGTNTGQGSLALTAFVDALVAGGNAIIKQAPRTIGYPTGFTYIANEAAGVALGAGAVGYPAE